MKVTVLWQNETDDYSGRRHYRGVFLSKENAVKFVKETYTGFKFRPEEAIEPWFTTEETEVL